MNCGCPNCDALCSICRDNTWNSHEPLCSSCRLAVAHEQERIIKLLEAQIAYAVSMEGFYKGDSLTIETDELIALIKGEK